MKQAEVINKKNIITYLVLMMQSLTLVAGIIFKLYSLNGTIVVICHAILLGSFGYVMTKIEEVFETNSPMWLRILCSILLGGTIFWFGWFIFDYFG